LGNLSRSFIGHPRVGPYDAPEDALPFHLMASNPPPRSGRWVVEVHPAVVIWPWCRGVRGATAEWKYQGQAGLAAEIWETPHRRCRSCEHFTGNTSVAPSSDDQLDARVAYALGRLWVEAPDEVILLGDINAGTFLLPRVEGLADACAAFIERSAQHPNGADAPTVRAFVSPRRAARSEALDRQEQRSIGLWSGATCTQASA